MKALLALLFLFLSTAALAQSISGEIWLQPTDDGRLAVMVSTTPGSIGPQSFAFKLVLSRDAVTSIEKSGDVANCTPVFSWSNNVSYVAVLDRSQCPLVGGNTYEVARVSVGVIGPWPVTVDFEPSVTILSDYGGKITATTKKGTLRLTGYTVDVTRRRSAGH
jgi:hypothetical protein